MNKSLWIDNNIDMINLFIHELLKFTNKYSSEITLNTDSETFYGNFVDFLFQNYYLDKEMIDKDYDHNFEYFDSMYSTDIIDLFSEFKEISYRYTSDLFASRNESYSLSEFIYDNINLEDDHNLINEEIYEEYCDDDYY